MNQLICLLLTIRPYLLKDKIFLAINNKVINKLTLELIYAYQIAINSDVGYEKMSKITENKQEIYGTHGKVRKVLLRPTKYSDCIDIYYENGSISPAQDLFLTLFIKNTY